MEKLIRTVSEVMQIPESHILSKKRDAKTTNARCVISGILFYDLKYRQYEIAQAIGRTRDNVNYLLNRYKDYKEQDKEFRRIINAVKHNIPEDVNEPTELDKKRVEYAHLTEKDLLIDILIELRKANQKK